MYVTCLLSALEILVLSKDWTVMLRLQSVRFIELAQGSVYIYIFFMHTCIYEKCVEKCALQFLHAYYMNFNTWKMFSFDINWRKAISSLFFKNPFNFFFLFTMEAERSVENCKKKNLSLMMIDLSEKWYLISEIN